MFRWISTVPAGGEGDAGRFDEDGEIELADLAVWAQKDWLLESGTEGELGKWALVQKAVLVLDGPLWYRGLAKVFGGAMACVVIENGEAYALQDGKKRELS